MLKAFRRRALQPIKIVVAARFVMRHTRSPVLVAEGVGGFEHGIIRIGQPGEIVGHAAGLRVVDLATLAGRCGTHPAVLKNSIGLHHRFVDLIPQHGVRLPGGRLRRVEYSTLTG